MRRFTLVELLVTIAILAILITLLLLLVSRVRETSKLAKCLNNFRQQSACVQLYAGDNDEFFPTRYVNQDGVPQYNSLEWGIFINSLRTYITKGPAYLDTWERTGYLDENVYSVPRAWVCDAYYGTKIPSNVFQFRPSRQGYIRMRVLAPLDRSHPLAAKTNTPAGFRLGQLPSPSRYSIGAETGWEFSGYTSSAWERHISTRYASHDDVLSGNTPYGHKNGWSVMFLDGHVNFMRKKRLTSTNQDYGMRQKERVVAFEDL